MTLDLDRLATLAFNNYYATELNTADAVREYAASVNYENDSDFGRLVDALADDIHDLLHNGNGEDLFGPLDDLDDITHQLHDGWTDDNMFTLCTNIARIAYAAL